MNTEWNDLKKVKPRPYQTVAMVAYKSNGEGPFLIANKINIKTGKFNVDISEYEQIEWMPINGCH